MPPTALLDAANHPDITFTGESTRPHARGWIVAGQLSVHGAGAPVELLISEADEHDGIAHFHATATVDRTTFGITKKKGTVGSTASITIDASSQPGR